MTEPLTREQIEAMDVRAIQPTWQVLAQLHDTALHYEARLREVEAERDRLARGLWGSSAATIVALKHRAEKAEAERDKLREAFKVKSLGYDDLRARVAELEEALRQIEAEPYYPDEGQI